MKLNTQEVLKDLDDETDLEMELGKPASMEQVIARALVAAYKGEEELTLDKKMERWQLFQKLKAQHLPVEITEPEATMIEQLVNKLYGGVLIPARVRETLVRARAFALEVKKPKANGEAHDAAVR